MGYEEAGRIPGLGRLAPSLPVALLVKNSNSKQGGVE